MAGSVSAGHNIPGGRRSSNAESRQLPGSKPYTPVFKRDSKCPLCLTSQMSWALKAPSLPQAAVIMPQALSAITEQKSNGNYGDHPGHPGSGGSLYHPVKGRMEPGGCGHRTIFNLFRKIKECNVSYIALITTSYLS